MRIEVIFSRVSIGTLFNENVSGTFPLPFNLFIVCLFTSLHDVSLAPATAHLLARDEPLG